LLAHGLLDHLGGVARPEAILSMRAQERPSLGTLRALYFTLFDLSLLHLIEGIGDHTTLQTGGGAQRCELLSSSTFRERVRRSKLLSLRLRRALRRGHEHIGPIVHLLLEICEEIIASESRTTCSVWGRLVRAWVHGTLSVQTLVFGVYSFTESVCAGRGGASGLEAKDALRAGEAVGLCADVAEKGELLRSKDQEALWLEAIRSSSNLESS
jgi:hypothetical protein